MRIALAQYDFPVGDITGNVRRIQSSRLFDGVRSSPQRFDCVLSIVVWCGIPPHHQYPRANRNGWPFFSPSANQRARTAQPADKASACASTVCTAASWRSGG